MFENIESNGIDNPEKIEWSGMVPVPGVAVNQYGDRDQIFLKYENGSFFVDEKKVDVSKFLEVLGKGKDILFQQRPDLKEEIEKIEKEKKVVN